MVSRRSRSRWIAAVGIAMLLAAVLLAAWPERPSDALAGTETGGFAIPPKTVTPSLAGTPYADFDAPQPASTAEAAAPKVRYRNGVRVDDSTAPVILLSAEIGEQRDGVLQVPAYIGDVSYLSAQVQTEAQTAIAGKPLTVRSARGNPVLVMADATDAEGYIDFRVLARSAGRDTLTVEAAGVSTRVVLDVQTPPANDWFGDLDLRGVTPWALLIDTPIDYGRDAVTARFPAALRDLDGTSVRLAGFMLPLESAMSQRRFLLTANPPACFFHPPGGPTSVIEVQAPDGIETSLDAVVIEGRLRLQTRSADGLIYRLEGARLRSRS